MHNKFNDFQDAMNNYQACSIYSLINRMTSISIVTLQALTVIQMFQLFQAENYAIIIAIIILSYITTDFINGLIHMYMDNNTQYRGPIGPFIAAFHLHHLSPTYRNRHPLAIYFFESGTKFWLLGYLIALIFIQPSLSTSMSLFWVGIGIFSSFAEVSHYWCHNATDQNYIIRFLQSTNILLSKKHHQAHHQFDNVNYAFLNGISDPALNLIASKLFDGYKSHSDRHAMAYRGKQTSNRS